MSVTWETRDQGRHVTRDDQGRPGNQALNAAAGEIQGPLDQGLTDPLTPWETGDQD